MTMSDKDIKSVVKQKYGEIAKVALFLACGLSEFVTGEHLLATGGYTMR